MITGTVFIVFYFVVEASTKTVPPARFVDWKQLIDEGVSISERIKQPSGDSLRFIEDIQIYYESLENVMEGLKKNDSTSLEVFSRLKENGGPPHLTLYPVSPVAHLIEFYEWDDFTTWQFRGLMKYTWVLWLNMQDYVKEASFLPKIVKEDV